MTAPGLLRGAYGRTERPPPPARLPKAAMFASRWLAAAVVVVSALTGVVAPAAGQTPAPIAAPKSLCADCHLAESTPRARAHILDWQRSTHAKRGVACEACHGGDAATVDPMRAHLAIKGAEDPAGPVHRSNLPETCGKCHTRSAEQFRKSRHFMVLKTDSGTTTPTCSTCHGEAGTTMPEAEEARIQCAQCHALGRAIDHAEYPPAAKLIIVQYSAARMMLEGASSFIPLVSSAVDRTSLELEVARAAQALATAAEATHTVDYDTIDGRLSVAFDRIVALIRRVMTTGAVTLTAGERR